MKTYCLLLLLTISSKVGLFAQWSSPAVHVNANFPLLEYERVPLLGNSDLKTSGLINISPSLFLYSEETASYHGIEIWQFRIKKEEKDLQFKYVENLFSLRYERGAVLNFSSDRLRVRVGGAMRIYSGKRSGTPIQSQNFPFAKKETGLLLGATAHLEYFVFPKFSLSVSPHISLLNLAMRSEMDENPVTPTNFKRSKLTRLDVPSSEFIFRIGAGWHF